VHTLPVLAAEWLERVVDQLRHVGIAPALLAEQFVRPPHRGDAAVEFLQRIGDVLGVSERLRGDRLHGLQRILDPVVELVDHERMHRLGARQPRREANRESETDQQQHRPKRCRQHELAP
jgi:hypothetical protein